VNELKAVLIFLTLLLASLASSSPDEVFGLVTHAIDGDTVDLEVLNCTDDRVAANDTIRVRFADVDTPETRGPKACEAGKEAAAYTRGWLEGKHVFLDLDNKTGKDEFGRWVAVVYLVNYSCCSPPSPGFNFNRQLVDAGFAEIKDFKNNEFNPDSWWEVVDPRLAPGR
jgi:endonuclease YncB( thermonuclease family)